MSCTIWIRYMVLYDFEKSGKTQHAEDSKNKKSGSVGDLINYCENPLFYSGHWPMTMNKMERA